MSQGVLSRRGFFSRLREALGNIPSGFADHRATHAQESRGETLPTDTEPTATGELLLGSLREFPVGHATRRPELGIEVLSSERGMRARALDKNAFCALRMDPRGRIWANPREAWEANQVLCPLTGEKRTL